MANGLINAARDEWIRRLIDTSRRNNLLYFRELKVGTLDLQGAEEDPLNDLIAGQKVSLARLVPTEAEPRAGSKLTQIVRKARSNLEEKGLETLFLAYGMASWPADDEGKDPEAAVLLLPLRAEGKRSDSESLQLEVSGPPQANIALLHALAEEFSLTITEEDLIGDVPADLNLSALNDILHRFHQSASHIKNFALRQRKVIGNFSFQKLAMVKELKDRGDSLAGHSIVAALAGDVDARQVAGMVPDPAERGADLDNIPPHDEHVVLDADSSQQAAIRAALKGINGVIHGPPGTGKSQTIANIITTLVSAGKKVLFVAEKRAALEAVKKRLDQKGLGHLALDLHGASVSPKDIMRQVRTTLDFIRTVLPPDGSDLFSKFEERRRRLINHVTFLHTRLPPSDRSPYEIQAAILEAARALSQQGVANSQTRWRGSDLAKLTSSNCEQIANLISEAIGNADLLSHRADSPWVDATMVTGADVEQAITAVNDLQNLHLPALLESIKQVCSQSRLRMPRSVIECEELLSVTHAVNQTLTDYDEAIFQVCDEGLADLHPIERGMLAMTAATLFNPRYRRARATLLGARKLGKCKPARLLSEVKAAAGVRKRWHDAGGSEPRSVAVPSGLQQTISVAREDLAVLCRLLPSVTDVPIEDLPELLGRLRADSDVAYRIPRTRQIESGISLLGGALFLEEIRSANLKPIAWRDTFLHAWYCSCYDAMRTQNVDFASFDGTIHTAVEDEFSQLDRKRISLAERSVLRSHAEMAVVAMNSYPAEAQQLKYEASKRTRHMPLRKLASQTSNVLPSVCPCWMSSPLNVSQLLPSVRQMFDIVIFDEASQVLPEDAVCSILRADQLVVAGDSQQLPPTTFFADGAGSGSDGDEDDGLMLAGVESLLDQVSAFLPSWRLLWHYRSKDERLIAFSNRNIYHNSLTTFPGIGGDRCISHVLVDGVPCDGEEESSAFEVKKVVELIVEHAQNRRNESLGVIAMGIKHANRVQAALDEVLRSQPGLEEFFDPNKEERFFIKNLERVQGDERDAIILTIGYGRNRHGKVLHFFGPINYEGGERRLNVAVTRARSSLTLVSSFTDIDLDPNKLNSCGAKLLRDYIAFARSEGTNLGDEGGQPIEMNAFEIDVFETLSAKGMGMVPQYGCSGYRLDFAVQHPTSPGLFVLALECDGATYHSGQTARDRDRLRQQQLEAMGWSFHRIWSTDWFLKREQTINTVLKVYEAAVDQASKRIASDKDRGSMIGGLFGSGEEEESCVPSPDEASTPQRGQMPYVGDYYTQRDLVRIVQWVCSDGLLRTDDEIVDQVLPVLRRQRRTQRIVSEIMQAITTAQRIG